jgi:hypothetical protein
MEKDPVAVTSFTDLDYKSLSLSNSGCLKIEQLLESTGLQTSGLCVEVESSRIYFHVIAAGIRICKAS